MLLKVNVRIPDVTQFRMDERSLWLWSYGSLQLPDQSVPITTKGVSSNHVHGEVYSIQHYVTKFVSDLRQISGFHRELRFPSPIELTATI